MHNKFKRISAGTLFPAHIIKRSFSMLKALARLLFLGFALGCGFWEKVRISFFLLFSRAKNFLGLNKLPQVKEFLLDVNGKSIKLQISNDFADAELLREIFIEQEYHIRLEPEPKVIFDLGSNVGFAAVYFKSLFPQASIYCFEPDSDIFQRLEENIKLYSGMRAFQYALGRGGEFREFYKNPEFHMRSSFISRDARERKVEVPCLTLDDAILRAGVDTVDLLKFDVEGAEVEIFANFHDWNRINCIIGEIHPHLAKDSEINGLLEVFKKHYQISTIRKNNKIFMEGRRHG